uniref:Uncharacterized protein n=1 Tax=Anopheles quadriannulatus TaxID=34691 RepID=A0A182XS90_ANOQN
TRRAYERVFAESFRIIFVYCYFCHFFVQRKLSGISQKQSDDIVKHVTVCVCVCFNVIADICIVIIQNSSTKCTENK